MRGSSTLPPYGRYRGAIDDVAEVLATNAKFYEAFEARNLDAISDLWERSDRAACTHPGWTRLRGWAAISASFAALFQSGQALQFILTECEPLIVGDVAWVTLDENLLGDQGGATVATINIFVRSPEDGRWLMIGHHGSPVSVTRP